MAGAYLIMYATTIYPQNIFLTDIIAGSAIGTILYSVAKVKK